MRQAPSGSTARVAWPALIACSMLAARGHAAPPKDASRPESPQAAPKPSREPRKVYLTAGHGELTDPGSIPEEMKSSERKSTELKRVLGASSYEIEDLGARELARGIPDDAAILIVAAPTVPLQPGEWGAIERYLDRGGRVMIILDPLGVPSMGSLEGRLGLRMLPGHLADDKAFLPQRGTLADRRLAITTQLSAHASTAGLARAVGQGLVMIDSGALEEIPFTSKGKAPKRTITIRSMESSWLDLEQPQSFSFDPPREKRQRWNLAAAVEGPKINGEDGSRVLVFSDADLFADVHVSNAPGKTVRTVLVSGPLLGDSIRWLAGEDTAGDPKP